MYKEIWIKHKIIWILKTRLSPTDFNISICQIWIAKDIANRQIFCLKNWPQTDFTHSSMNTMYSNYPRIFQNIRVSSVTIIQAGQQILELSFRITHDFIQLVCNYLYVHVHIWDDMLLHQLTTKSHNHSCVLLIQLISYICLTHFWTIAMLSLVA